MRGFFTGFRCSFAAILLCCLCLSPAAFAQNTSGRVDVTVVDPSGAVVSGAKLTLQDLSTNYTRDAETPGSGTYSFVNLNIGNYKLTVTRSGFQPQEYNPVLVSATKATAVTAKLKIGQTSQTVVVEGGAAPILETTTNSIGTTIDLKQIESLPMSGRDLTQLSRLSPGYTGSGTSGAGTWNGLPSIAQGNNVDGVIGSPSRMKFSGNSNSSISPRLEDIEEMTVQTDSLNLDQGFGQAAMQINYVTRRGSNAWHGRLFEDHRNSALNANSWTNDARHLAKPHLIMNDFGGSVGGPILHNKLFFFFSLANQRRPGGVGANSNFLTPAAQGGLYTYTGTDSQSHTVDLLALAAANGLPTGNSAIGGPSGQFAAINKAVTAGAVTPTSDPNIDNVAWNFSAPTIVWYPTLRLDYNTSRTVTMNFAINRTKTTNQGANAPWFPGSDFASTGSGNQTDGFTASYGIDWTVRPTMMNQFKVGYLYNVNRFAYNTSKGYQQDPNNVNYPLGLQSPAVWNVPVTSYYPLVNVSDNFSWQKGAHSLNFGFSFYREQDHYWNPPELQNINFGLVQGDPAYDNVFSQSSNFPASNDAILSEAQDMYALIVGRISGVNGSFPYDQKTNQYIQKPALAYNLDELSKAWGLFFQDSWRIRPTLTINYGLRWDFTGANHDLTSAYHNADTSSLYGPSGVGNLFKPGTLTGNMNPTLEARPRPYQNWNKSPQPAIGFAWNPQFSSGLLHKLAGDGTVIRGGFSLRNFTVPYQYFWDNASDYGSFFYQFYSLNPTTCSNPNDNTSCQQGFYNPGSLSLGNSLPPFLLEPTAYQPVAPESLYTFLGGPGVNGMKYNIRQPYTETWNFGIQRKVGSKGVLELRYNGNRTLHQWISVNLNEVNVFENGFLTDFQNAQKNLAINGGSSFGNTNPGAGTVPVPIITAAFTGSTTGSQTDPHFSNGGFITNLNNGQVGSFANSISGLGDIPYLCNMVGAGFAPCANNLGYTGAGAGFPINFFQANPFAAGNGVGYMTDAGYSTYNGLQVDFRERAWHGITTDANYTWSHTLGVSTPNDWTGAYPSFTLRNLHQSYGPTLYDLRHVIHVNATVDLPFGKGRAFLNQGGVVDKVLGGWNLGTIVTYQTGYPFRVLGGNRTFNNIADGGVTLNGLTRQQLQNAVGVYPVAGSATVAIINPSLLKAPTGGANPSKIIPNTTPGTIAPPIYLYGPHGFFDDIAITKEIPITERWHFTFQTEMLNAFNHPVFAQNTTPIGSGVKSPGWGAVTGANDLRFGNIPGFNRQIEFRANLTF